MAGRSRFSDEQRFYMKADRPSYGTCWIWDGSSSQDYGCVYWQGRRQGAHRVSWMIANKREIPNDYDVMHSCDVRKCVNPRHLSLGTRSDNMQDAKGKSRLGGPRKRKALCHRGHPRTPENLTRRRQCRQCANMLHGLRKKGIRRMAAYLPQSPLLARGLEADDHVSRFEGADVVVEAADDE